MSQGGAIATADKVLNDYLQIKVADPEARRPRPLTPQDTIELHMLERAWLHSQPAEPFAGATVVAMHHGPAAGSVAPRSADDWLPPASSNNLPDDFFQVPALWVHKHSYDSRDYIRSLTRVLYNPRGYPLPSDVFENESFDPALIA